MVIRTILTCVIRFFRSIRAAFVSVSPSRTYTNDIEAESFGTADVEMGRTSARTESSESPSSSYYVFGRQISTVRPMKSRIVDVVLRNVRDKRSSVLKEVVITRSSSLHLPCSVKVEGFPGPTPPSRASISSALRVLKTSGERVVKFVLTPTLLLDADPLPRASRPARGDHSIEDIINLFPSPPAHVSVESAHSPLYFQPNLVARDSAKRSSSTEEYCSSLSTSGSVTSGDTATTSPPTTPELAQMARMIIASNGIGLLSVESQCRPACHVESPVEIVESASAVSMQTNCSRKQATLDQSRAFDPSCCTQATPIAVPHLAPWNNGYRKPESVIAFPLWREGDTFSTNAHEDGLSDVTSKEQAGNPDTHGFDAFWDANRRGGLRDNESCFSGISRYPLLCLNASTPSSSTGRAQVAPSSAEGTTDRSSTGASFSEGLAVPTFLAGTSPASDLNHSPTPISGSSYLGPDITTHGPRKGQGYCNTTDPVDSQTCYIGNSSTLSI